MIGECVANLARSHFGNWSDISGHVAAHVRIKATSIIAPSIDAQVSQQVEDSIWEQVQRQVA